MTIRTTLNAGVSARSMFHTPTTGSFMSRGAQVAYSPDDDAAAATEAARVAAEAEAAAAAKVISDAADAEAAAALAAKDKTKPTDAEAILLRDMMKHKDAAKTSKAALDAANAELAKYKGLDPAKLLKLQADADAAELTAAEKRGEYDRIITQVREDAETRVSAKDTEIANRDSTIAAQQLQIDNLVIGSAFTGSKFVSEETVLTGDKARRLYGDHFEIEDGVQVAYDKPRGSANRTPLVDPATGNPLTFEAAIEKVIRSDPDFKQIAKSKLKQGVGTTPNPTDKVDTKIADAAKPFGRDIIASALKKAALAK